MTDQDRDSRFAGTGVYAGLVALIASIAALVVLAAQNTDSVSVRWFGFEWTTPLIAVILGVMLVTVILDEVIGAVWRSRRRRVIAEREELKHRRAEAPDHPAPPTAQQPEEVPTG